MDTKLLDICARLLTTLDPEHQLLGITEAKTE